MTLTETQRIGHTMQQLVWRPANQVHTKTLAGLTVKIMIIGLLTLALTPIVLTYVVLSSKRLNTVIKILLVSLLWGCLVVWYMVG